MANVEAGTVKVKVEPVFEDMKEAFNRTFMIPEPKALERPDSELRLEAVKLAVRAHESLCLDGPIVETARAVAGYVIDGVVPASAAVAAPASVNEHDEYAVEVPGRGYLDLYSSKLREAHEVNGSPSESWALDEAERVRNRYRVMGCPDVAETVRVVSRKVTTSRGHWAAA